MSGREAASEDQGALAQERYDWPGVSVAIVDHPPDADVMTPGTHELGFVLHPLSGHEASIDDGPPRSFDMPYGMGWIVPAGARGYGAWRTPVRYLELRLEPWRFDAFVPDALDASRVRLTPAIEFVDPVLVQMGLALHGAAKDGGFLDALYRDSVLGALAAHLLRSWTNARAFESGTRHPSVRRAVEFVEDKLASDLSLDELAGAAGVSRFHFVRLFKAETGLSPHQYVMKRRTERARELIAATGLPLSVIAHRSGFASVSHLSTWTKRLTGSAPSAFRSSGRSSGDDLVARRDEG